MKQLPAHQSTAGLAEELVQKIERLIQLERELAIQEAKELGIRNAIAVAMFAVAGILFMVAIFVGLPMLAVVTWPHWWTVAIWIAGYIVLGAILALVGKLRLKIAVPPKTMRSLQETKEWALTQLRSNGR
jgi:small-conductance mechanosensitive channel